jgi:hypothetical protein
MQQAPFNTVAIFFGLGCLLLGCSGSTIDRKGDTGSFNRDARPTVSGGGVVTPTAPIGKFTCTSKECNCSVTRTLTTC